MINFLDLKLQHNAIKNKIEKSIQRVLDSGILVGGKDVNNFEKGFAKFCGAKYAISVNSGTDALFLSLKALGIGQGDEVITTPFTFIATAEAITNCGARPVFVDIKSDTFNLDPELVEGLITKKTKAIMPVHIFGQMAYMAKIMRIAKKHKLFVIEDACQAVGAEYRAGLPRRSVAKAGTIGDAGCFSFFPSKNLGAAGDGGMIVTNDKKVNEKIRLLKNHGSSPKDKYKNLILGYNSRLDTIQAVILQEKLKHLKKWNSQRVKISKNYSNRLRDIFDIKTPEILDGGVFNQYTIKAKNRNGLATFLGKKGIETKIYYPLPLHLQPALKYLGYKKGDFPEAERSSKEVLSLPIYPELSKDKQDFIIKKIKGFYSN